MTKRKNSKLLIFIQLFNSQTRGELANVQTQELGTIDSQYGLWPLLLSLDILLLRRYKEDNI